MANRADATTSVSANGASGRSSKKIPWAHYLGLRKNMEPSYRNDLKLFIYLYFYGVHDAIRFDRVWARARRLPLLREMLLNSLLLNAGFFAGTHIAVQYLMLPVVARWVAPGVANGMLMQVLHLLYLILWPIPVYGVVVWANQDLYARIAGLCLPERPADASFLRIADGLYALLVSNALLLQSCVFGFVPLAGVLLGGVLTAWFYAFTFMEYRWAALRMPLSARLQRFEELWVYLLGLGTPITLLYSLLPFWIAVGVCAFALSVYIVMLSDVLPQAPCPKLKTHLPQRLPIFRSSIFLVESFLALLSLFLPWMRQIRRTATNTFRG